MHTSVHEYAHAHAHLYTHARLHLCMYAHRHTRKPTIFHVPNKWCSTCPYTRSPRALPNVHMHITHLGFHSHMGAPGDTGLDLPVDLSGLRKARGALSPQLRAARGALAPSGILTPTGRTRLPVSFSDTGAAGLRAGPHAGLLCGVRGLRLAYCHLTPDLQLLPVEQTCHTPPSGLQGLWVPDGHAQHPALPPPGLAHTG